MVGMALYDRLEYDRMEWPHRLRRAIMLRSYFYGVLRWVEPDYALGRQLYALRRCGGTNPIVYTGTGETGLEGRLLRS